MKVHCKESRKREKGRGKKEEKQNTTDTKGLACRVTENEEGNEEENGVQREKKRKAKERDEKVK